MVEPMLATALVLGFTSWAAWDDLRHKTIRNVITYSGIAVALAFHGLGSWGELNQPNAVALFAGAIGLLDSATGLLFCGFLMLAAYAFFQIGGGDVKLVAMVGAFLGLEQGVETMLWTLVFGAAAAVCALIFKFGAVTLLRLALEQLQQALKLGPATELTPELKEALRPDLHLAPCAVAALCVVKFWPA